ncbi:MAG: PBP1A family penicillin-binding protein, partial [Deltaproteobacteria bacterium]|nr:PBP1A family penicillin-binding protein [Deltaproteobacteria bacterium]
MNELLEKNNEKNAKIIAKGKHRNRKLISDKLEPLNRKPGVLGEGQLKGKLPGAWRHPQAWVPREWAFFISLLPFIFWPVVGVTLVLSMYNQEMAGTALEDLKHYQPPTVSFIFASDDTLMAELYNEHRLVTPLDRIPKMVIEAFLAAEDSSFYQHQGVDLIGVGRALMANVKAGHTVQGASTITQQMIRSFLLTNEKTYDRKLKEMILAWRAERVLTKDDILFLYLNRIYLGRGAYGVESAARLYFGKTIREVTLGEAALLAGLAQAPGRLQAHLGTARSRERQLYVLRRMVEVGYITQSEATRAQNTPLKFLDRRPNIYRQVAPQFAEVVRIQMSDYLGPDRVLNDGLRIHTTLDLKAQAQAQEAVRNGLDALARRQRMSPKVRSLNQNQVNEYLRRARASLESRPLMLYQEPAGLVTEVITTGDNPGLVLSFGDDEGFMPAESISWLVGKRALAGVFKVNDLVMGRIMGRNAETGRLDLVPAPPPEIQGALVLMENHTGRVLAMVGGRDFGIEGVGNSDFNRAILAQRQPGSSFKPFVYTAALENGYTEASIVYDVPLSYPDGPGRYWRPRNAGGGHSGPLTLLDALRRSVNIVSVKLTDALGPQTVIDTAKKMGITTNLLPNLTLALGASEVTLLDMTKAYTTFPNLGSWVWPTFVDRVEDRYGRTIVSFEPYFTEAISPQTAYIMIDMLSAVAKSGTGARVGAALKTIPVAGKTGTTNSQADALFIGFTPEYTCGVWVGRETRVSLGGGE